MWLKQAAGFSNGAGVQSLPCLFQPFHALGFPLVPSEKEEMGPFPSVFGAGFHPFYLSPLTVESPLSTNPQERMADSIVPTSFSGLEWPCAPRRRALQSGGLREGGKGRQCPFSDVPAAEPEVPGARRDPELDQ